MDTGIRGRQAGQWETPAGHTIGPAAPPARVPWAESAPPHTGTCPLAHPHPPTSVPGWQRISCTTPRRITVDAGREAQQNRADVETGLKTLTDHYSELGSDFGDEIEKRAQDAKLILDTAQKYGVPVEMLWRPEGASSLLTPPQGNNPTVDTPPPA